MKTFYRKKHLKAIQRRRMLKITRAIYVYILCILKVYVLNCNRIR